MLPSSGYKIKPLTEKLVKFPVLAHFNQENHTLEDLKVAVLRAGLASLEYQKKLEMGFIFKYGTVSPSGLNQDLSVA